jgi:hypothetical protein
VGGTFITSYPAGGVERLSGAVEVADGDLIAVGNTTSPESKGMTGLLVRTDATGNVKWARHTVDSGAPNMSIALEGVFRLDDATIIAVGYRGTRSLIVALDLDGAVQWVRTFGSYEAWLRRGVRTPDGGFVVVGAQLLEQSFGSDALVTKFTADGELVWSRTIAGPLADSFADVAVGTDGSVYAVGTSAVPGTMLDGLIVKLDAVGQPVWTKKWVGAGLDGFNGVATTADGSLVLSASSEPVGADDKGTASVLGITADGALAWAFTASGVGRFSSIAPATDGTVFVAGEASSGTVSGAFFARVSPRGSAMWGRRWDALDGSAIRALIRRQQGGLVAVGSAITGATEQAFMMRLTELGSAAVACDPLAAATPTFGAAAPAFQPATLKSPPGGAANLLALRTLGTAPDVAPPPTCR